MDAEVMQSLRRQCLLALPALSMPLATELHLVCTKAALVHSILAIPLREARITAESKACAMPFLEAKPQNEHGGCESFYSLSLSIYRANITYTVRNQLLASELDIFLVRPRPIRQ